MADNGILDELEKLHIQEGDTVRMYGFSFEYYRNADTEVPEGDDETDEDDE
jgi:GTP-binding protein